VKPERRVVDVALLGLEVAGEAAKGSIHDEAGLGSTESYDYPGKNE
jgi:hypothetical protein